MQVVLTTIEPGKGRGDQAIDAYEYTVHSHTYNTDEIPSAKFSYDMSPIQVCLFCIVPTSFTRVCRRFFVLLHRMVSRGSSLGPG